MLCLHSNGSYQSGTVIKFDNRMTSQHGAAQCSVSFRRAFNCFGYFSVVFALYTQNSGREPRQNNKLQIPCKNEDNRQTIMRDFPSRFEEVVRNGSPFQVCCSLCYQFLGSCRILWYKRKECRDLH